MASGDTLLVFTPNMSEPPATNYATLGFRNKAIILEFDDTTDESIEFFGFMPANYGGGGVTVIIGWMATTATSNNVVWNVAFKSFTPDADDLDTKAFAAVNAVTDAAATASGEIVNAEITFTDGADMDSVAAGEYFRLNLTRDANNGSDNMTGDAEVVFVAIKET